ncbi:MAG: universal stress protein [Terracidiphilus sp.]
MAAFLKPGWSRPSTMLFAAETPVNEKAFGFALAQCAASHAKLILFHVYDLLVASALETSSVRYCAPDTASRVESQLLRPLARRCREVGVECEIVVRPGLAVDEILRFLGHRSIDRIVMGSHAPGPIGKLLAGSVAEGVLRNSRVPVFIVGPEAVDGAYRNFATRTILCAASLREPSQFVVGFAAALAAEHSARLILQHVIRSQARVEVLASPSVEKIEAELSSLVPEELRNRIGVQPIVVTGDPAEELLYQCRMLQADLIVTGAQGASTLAAAARQGVVYKLLAHAHCPVMTLSPAALRATGASDEKVHVA